MNSVKKAWSITVLLMNLCFLFSFLDLYLGTEYLLGRALVQVTTSEEKRLYLRDPEGGGQERTVLFLKVSVVYQGLMREKSMQITDDFWVGGGEFSKLRGRFQQGKEVEVRVFKPFPDWLILNPIIVWGRFLMTNIGLLIVGIFIFGLSGKSKPVPDTDKQ